MVSSGWSMGAETGRAWWKSAATDDIVSCVGQTGLQRLRMSCADKLDII